MAAAFAKGVGSIDCEAEHAHFLWTSIISGIDAWPESAYCLEGQLRQHFIVCCSCAAAALARPFHDI